VASPAAAAPLDPSFGTGGVARFGHPEFPFASAMVRQPADGKLVVGGYSRSTGSKDDFSMVRYNAYGSVDTSFG